MREMLSKMEHITADLEEITSTLVQRLNPVMHAEPPTAEGGDKEPCDSYCEMADAINQLHKRINQQVRTLRNINKRLEV